MKRVTFDEIDAGECRIKSAFLIWWYFLGEEFELMKSELQQSLPTYEITVGGRNVRFYSAVEEFDAEYPLSFLMELYKLDMLYDLFILPALVPN